MRRAVMTQQKDVHLSEKKEKTGQDVIVRVETKAWTRVSHISHYMVHTHSSDTELAAAILQTFWPDSGLNCCSRKRLADYLLFYRTKNSPEI